MKGVEISMLRYRHRRGTLRSALCGVSAESNPILTTSPLLLRRRSPEGWKGGEPATKRRQSRHNRKVVYYGTEQLVMSRCRRVLGQAWRVGLLVTKEYTVEKAAKRINRKAWLLADLSSCVWSWSSSSSSPLLGHGTKGRLWRWCCCWAQRLIVEQCSHISSWFSEEEKKKQLHAPCSF